MRTQTQNSGVTTTQTAIVGSFNGNFTAGPSQVDPLIAAGVGGSTLASIINGTSTPTSAGNEIPLGQTLVGANSNAFSGAAASVNGGGVANVHSQVTSCATALPNVGFVCQ